MEQELERRLRGEQDDHVKTDDDDNDEEDGGGYDNDQGQVKNQDEISKSEQPTHGENSFLCFSLVNTVIILKCTECICIVCWCIIHLYYLAMVLFQIKT